MIVHKCDRCGREMASWINVYSANGAEEYNVLELMHEGVKREYCKPCYEAIRSFAENFTKYQKGAALDV